MKTGVVSSKELGTGCIIPARFLGGLCNSIKWCKKPEKSTCKAFMFVTVRTEKKIKIYANKEGGE